MTQALSASRAAPAQAQLLSRLSRIAPDFCGGHRRRLEKAQHFALFFAM
jgi:hypothetical protein